MGPKEITLERLPHTIEYSQAENAASFAYIDQRKLPAELVQETTEDWTAVVDAIKTLAVRGAPAIGISGAAALALWAHEYPRHDLSDAEYLRVMGFAADFIIDARPTAVNLSWAVKRALECGRRALADGYARFAVASKMGELVIAMQAEDEQTNRAIGANGAALIEPGSSILTHCNAGSLGTYYFGTALGIVYTACGQGKIERVYADETRPVGQGARLTTWELSRANVPVTLICDDMAASLMATGAVDAVIVGADRIAANGDTANKIGTYGVAILAHEHGIPFYVAAPTSTIDMNIESGDGIVIEQRAREEVLPQAIDGVEVWNPAFDVTPARYIDRIITETGVFAPSALS